MNKTIWITWFQGWDSAPEICQYCLRSWEQYNPDWKIVKLDSSNYRDYVDIESVLPGVETNLTAFSDVLRLFLLKEYGGVWADATLFCNRSLSTWVPGVKDAFLFTRPDIMVTSWFIAAHNNSYIVDKWYGVLVEYWKERLKGNDRHKGNYSWVHALFRDAYRDDTLFRNFFDQEIKIDASCYMDRRGKGPHLFTPYEHFPHQLISNPLKNRILSQKDPAYKLTYKISDQWKKPGTELDFLFGTLQS